MTRRENSSTALTIAKPQQEIGTGRASGPAACGQADGGERETIMSKTVVNVAVSASAPRVRSATRVGNAAGEMFLKEGQLVAQPRANALIAQRTWPVKRRGEAFDW